MIQNSFTLTHERFTVWTRSFSISSSNLILSTLVCEQTERERETPSALPIEGREECKRRLR